MDCMYSKILLDREFVLRINCFLDHFINIFIETIRNTGKRLGCVESIQQTSARLRISIYRAVAWHMWEGD